MHATFYNRSDFNVDISQWDVSSVTKMEAMFLGASSFNRDIGDWDVSNVKSFKAMFSNATLFNQDIGDWNVSSGSEFGSMFSGATSFNQDLSYWDARNATDYTNFHENSGISSDDKLPVWGGHNHCDVSQTSNKSFHGSVSPCKDMLVINQNDFSAAKNQGYKYELTSVEYTGDQFYTGNVTDMSYYFQNENNIDFDISGWDTSSVTNMDGMFQNASNFNQNLATWDVSFFSGEPQGFADGADNWDDANKPLWATAGLDPGLSTIAISSGSPSSVFADGLESANVTVTALYGDSTPFSGLEVEIFSDDIPTQSDSNDGLIVTNVTEILESDGITGTGVYTADVASTQVGTASLSATLDGIALTSSPTTVNFLKGPDPQESTVTPSTTAPIANSTTVTITVNLKDDGGAVVKNYSGLTGEVVDGDGNAIAAATLSAFTEEQANSDGTGTHTATLTSTQGGAHYVNVYIGAQLIGASDATSSAALTFNGDAGNLNLSASSLAVNKARALPDNSDAIEVAVTVLDTSGVPVFGLGDVAVLKDASSAGTATDQGDGTYTLALTSDSVATHAITATVGGSAIKTSDGSADESLTIRFSGDEAAIDLKKSSLAVVGDTSVVADGSEKIEVVVTVLDNNNAGAGYGVNAQSVRVFRGTSDASGTLMTDNGDGTYTAELTSTTAQSETLRAEVNDGAVLNDDNSTQTVEVTFVPGALYTGNSSFGLSSSSTTSYSVDTGAAFFARAKDANGNAITGLTAADFIVSANDASNTLIDDVVIANFVASSSDEANGEDGLYKFDLISQVADVRSIMLYKNDASFGLIAFGQNRVEVTYTAGAAAAVTSSVVADPVADVSIDNSSTVTINVGDQYANPVIGLVRSTTDTDFTWTIKNDDGDEIASANLGDFAESDSTPGEYTASLTSLTLGTHSLTLEAGGVEIAGANSNTPPQVTFVVGAADADNSSVVASPDADVSTDGGDDGKSTITVTVKDAGGNAIFGLGSDDFASSIVDSSSSAINGASLTFVEESTTTPGDYSFTLASSVTGVHTVTVEAVASPSNIALGSVDVSFVPGVVNADNSSVARATSGDVSTDTTETITVTVKDAGGNAIFGLGSDDFASSIVDSSSSAINGASLTFVEESTTTPGDYSFTLASSVTGVHTVTVEAVASPSNIALGSVDVSFVPGVANADNSSVARATSGDVSTDTTETITVTVKDAGGNAIFGLGSDDFASSIVDSSSSAINGASLTFVEESTTTPGDYSFTLASSVTGVHTVTVEAVASPSNIALGSVDVSFVPGVANADNSSVARATSGDVSTDTTETITVTVKDAGGNAIFGLGSDDFASSIVDSSSSAINGASLTFVEESTTTPGDYSFTLASSVTGVHTVTVEAVASPSNIALGSVDVSFVPGVANADNSSVARATSGDVSTDTTETITVTVKDAGGNAIFGLGSDDFASSIVDSSSSAINGASLTFVEESTTTPGDYSFTLASSVTGVHTVTVEAVASPSNIALGSVDVSFVPGVVNADNSSVARATSGDVSTDTTETITVTVKDAGGNAIFGLGSDDFASSIVDSSSSAINGASLTFVEESTTTPGDYSFTLASSVTGVHTVTVEAVASPSNIALGSVDVSFVPGVANADNSSVARATSGDVSTDTTETITVTVKDAGGNAIFGLGSDDFASSIVDSSSSAINGASLTFVEESTTTPGDYSFTLASSVTGVHTVTVEAVASPSNIALGSVDVSFVPGVANADNSSVARATSGDVSTDTTETITVTVKDAGGNAIFGLGSDDFASSIVDSSSSAINGASLTFVEESTTTPGDYSFTLASSVTGVHTVTVEAVASPSNIALGSVDVSFVPGVANADNSSVARATSGDVSTDTTETITVTVKDAGGNAIFGLGSDDFASSIVDSSSSAINGASLTFVEESTTTPGDYSFTLASSVTGVHTVTVEAVASPSNIALGSVDVSFVPGVVNADNSSVARATSGDVSTDTTETITVTVKDAGGNAIFGLGSDDFASSIVDSSSSAINGASLTFVEESTTTPGDYSFTLASSVTGVHTVTVEAVASPSNIALGSVDVSFVPGVANADNSSVARATSGDVSTDTTETITVTVKDAGGNAIFGLGSDDFASSIVDSSSSAINGASLTFVEESTTTPGDYSFTLASSVTGVHTVTVEAVASPSNIALGSVDVSFVPGVANADNSSVARATSGDVSTDTTETITVTVKDAGGNAIFGLGSDDFASSIVDSSSSAINGASLTFVEESTTTPGDYSFTLASSVTGVHTVTVEAVVQPPQRLPCEHPSRWTRA